MDPTVPSQNNLVPKENNGHAHNAFGSGADASIMLLTNGQETGVGLFLRRTCLNYLPWYIS